MDKVIEAARNLGKRIQEDNRFIAYQLALQANEEDTILQQLMQTFEKERIALSEEVQKEEKDTERLKSLDTSVRELYAEIMERDSVVTLADAQKNVRQLLDFVNQIVTKSGEGLDPDTIEYERACNTGGCGGCSGCK